MSWRSSRRWTSRPVIVDETATKLGGVETRAHAKVCAELFKQHRERIEGVVVVLPNFGDEKGVADTMRLSGLDVPILVQAYPDDVTSFTLERRRDSFCGKISVCSDLRQYGFAYTLTERHTVPVAVGRVPRRPGQLRARLQGRQRHEDGPPGRHRHAAGRLQDGALQREAAGGLGHRRQRHRPLGDLRPGRQADRRPRRGDGQAGRDPRPHRAPHGAAGPAREDGPPGRRHRRLDGRQRPQRLAPSSAGTRSRRTSASTSARS